MLAFRREPAAVKSFRGDDEIAGLFGRPVQVLTNGIFGQFADDAG